MEELERQRQIAQQLEEMEKNERKERERQKELARIIEEDRKKEMERRRQQEMARQIEEKQKKEREELERQQRIAWEIEEKQKKEREELERQQQFAREIEERQKKERAEQERQQKERNLTLVLLITVGISSIRMLNMPERMNSHNGVESAIESNNIVYFTKTPSTTPSAFVEWTTESPSRVIAGCALSEDCPFNYEQDLLCAHPLNDPSRYLQCTPMIGRRGRWMERNCPPSLILFSRYRHWEADMLSCHRQLSNPEPPSVFMTPPPNTIYQTIESFPQDLNPFNRNTIHPAHYGTEDVEIAPSVIDPPFPRVEPYFSSPFGKQRDDSVEGDFIGGFIKPVIKKIAMDQAETFLDQILSDEAIKEDNANTQRHPSTLSEDSWRVKSG
ncbi:hypothetical protein OSTOST_18956 [Ostertagia ostertagi]